MPTFPVAPPIATAVGVRIVGEGQLREISGGDVEHVQVLALMERMRDAMAGSDMDMTDPDVLSAVMTATALLGGEVFGSLIIAGHATDQDKRRAVASVERNYRTGIEVGKRRALRLLTERHGGNA
ncbi:hypothetical protein ACFSGX_14080 [Sphingomonas arantia]|uniref:Uncharacterized protein n=1 Tax=Sphingomonas arantia TaxID=1460676 RepID=A0ABW4TZH8_9SPHN